MVLRWLIDGTRLTQLACDNAVALATVYRYLHEGIELLAAEAPDIHQALLRAKAAGLTHLLLNDTLIPTDRLSPKP